MEWSHKMRYVFIALFKGYKLSLVYRMFVPQKANKSQRQGAAQALIQITELLGHQLRDKLSTLWDYLFTSIKEVDVSFEKCEKTSR